MFIGCSKDYEELNVEVFLVTGLCSVRKGVHFMVYCKIGCSTEDMLCGPEF